MNYCANIFRFDLSGLDRIDISRYPDGNTVHYTGIDAFDYYYGFITYWGSSIVAWFRDFSWQIQVSFAVILICILTMIVVAVRFYKNIKKTRAFEKEVADATEKYRDAFYSVLIQPDEPTIEEMEKLCGDTVDTIREYSPNVYSTILSSLRLELSEITLLPNVNFLCRFTGVTQFYEQNLINKRDILSTLQNIVTMSLRISEGLLAVYINHHNTNIRHMARMAYIICTETEPYRYLEEDLQEPQALWRPMMLHRLFGWLKETERQMPQFLVLASIMKDETTAAFLIEEIAYWGSPKEKSTVKDFFLSPMFKCRQSALRVVALLCDETQESAIIDSYEHQTDSLRCECLKAVSAINSGRQTQFFVDAYYGTSSKQIRECALSCMYNYGAEGRRRFEMMRTEIAGDQMGINLLNQIDSMAVLNQMRNF
ncbi:MAG: hypothetical protein KBT20_07550 [Bacteroidales bacterium]|nr:hypothetical protein [Candidatus Liminaster caballi]